MRLRSCNRFRYLSILTSFCRITINHLMATEQLTANSQHMLQNANYLIRVRILLIIH
jgi:hypothetical protein